MMTRGQVTEARMKLREVIRLFEDAEWKLHSAAEVSAVVSSLKTIAGPYIDKVLDTLPRS